MPSDSVLIMSTTLSSPSRLQSNRAPLRIDGNGPPIQLKFPKSTLPKMIEESDKKFPRRRALVYFGMEMSYGQLFDHVNRCAAGLQALGLRKGERVALMMPNCPQYVIAYFGALRAGAIVTATSSMYTRREAAHQWHDAGATTLIIEKRLYPIAKAASADVPELQRTIVTGIRDYFPKNFAALDRALRSKRTPGKSKTSALLSRSSLLPWRDLLSLARHPRPVDRG